MTILKGIAWQHDRGLAPMLATAAEFARSHPDVQIKWEARPLQDFADFSVERLAEAYDLVVLDHPSMGAAARAGAVLPLDQHLSHQVLAALEAESLGLSHPSYFFGGRQWALAIDGAAQVSAYRADLLARHKVDVPRSWEEVLELAGVQPGFVTVPLLPVDALMCFFTLCANLGDPPFSCSSPRVVSEEIGVAALRLLKSLAEKSLEDCAHWNPIAVWERMSASDEIAYCPLGFGYSNYARPGYRGSTLTFTNIPSYQAGGPRGSTLGGAGLAISARCRDLPVALEYAAWVAGAECQSTIYFQSGGQPGNRRAWTDPKVNQDSNDFFKRTLPTLEQAYLRPRFDGFIDFQKAASQVAADFLQGRDNESGVLRRLEKQYWTYRRAGETNTPRSDVG